MSATRKLAARERIERLYQSWGRPDKTAAWRAPIVTSRSTRLDRSSGADEEWFRAPATKIGSFLERRDYIFDVARDQFGLEQRDVVHRLDDKRIFGEFVAEHIALKMAGQQRRRRRFVLKGQSLGERAVPSP